MFPQKPKKWKRNYFLQFVSFRVCNIFLRIKCEHKISISISQKSEIICIMYYGSEL